MFKHIHIFLKIIMCYLTGYIIVAALFAYEYVYYNDSVEQGVYHYANRLLISIIGCSGITYFSGMWAAALIVLLLIPVSSFILKKKTVKDMVLLVVSLAVHCIAVLMIILLSYRIDSPSGENMRYAHFNRFEKPDGDIVLCTQDAYPMYSGTIYIETAHNTLKEIGNYSTFYDAFHNAYWLDDKVRIVVTQVISYEHDDSKPKYKYTDITYEELARIKEND